jgi:hypothetical protein
LAPVYPGGQPDEQGHSVCDLDFEAAVGIRGPDRDGVGFVVEQEDDSVAGLVRLHGTPIGFAEGTHRASDDVRVEADVLCADRFVSVRSGEAKGAQVATGNVPLPVFAIWIGWVLDEGHVAELRRKKVASQYPLRILEIIGVSMTA